MRKLFLIAALAAAIGMPSGVRAAESMGDKLQAYIACLNEFSGPAFSARDRYASWAAESGPTGKETVIYGTYTISEPSKCSKSVAAANAEAPHDADLEAAGTAYADSVTALAPLLNEANEYYHQENYKDDNMAKGKAMHPKLLAAWSSLAAADDKLRSIVDRLNDEATQQELAEIEKKDGRGSHFLTLTIMTAAKKLTRVELDQEQPDPDKIQPLLDSLDKANQELDQYIGAHQDDAGFAVPQILKNSKDFALAARKLMRRVRDKTPFSHVEQMMIESGTGWTVDGSPAAVSKTYNALVDTYNRAH